MRNIIKLCVGVACLLCFISCKKKRNYGSIDKSYIDSVHAVLANANFDTAKSYDTPLCLFYHKKPLFKIKQTVNTLPTAFSFRPDPNLQYADYYPYIVDYLSIDDWFWIKTEDGSANGIVYFSADNRNKIFHVSGSWLLDIDSTQESRERIVKATMNKLFPCVVHLDTLLSNNVLQVSNSRFSQEFRLKKPDTAGSNFWSLTYSINLKR